MNGRTSLQAPSRGVLQTFIIDASALARKQKMDPWDYRTARMWGQESANPQIRSPTNSLQKPPSADTDNEGRLVP